MSSEDVTTEEYGLETMDSDNSDKDQTVTHVEESSKLVFSQDPPPPKVANSNRFCKKWPTFIVLALICIMIVFVALVAFSLSVSLAQREHLNIPVQCEKCMPAAMNVQQNLMNNLTSRVKQLEMLFDKVQAMLKESNDTIVELNSSNIPTMEDKFDSLEDKLKVNIITLRNELNKTIANVSLLSDQISQSQSDAQSRFVSLREELDVAASNVSSLSKQVSQSQTIIQSQVMSLRTELNSQVTRLNATVNKTDFRVSNLQSVQTVTQSQLTQLDSKYNIMATTVSELKSTQELAISNLTALDTRHDTTVAMVDDLTYLFSALQTSVRAVNISALSAVAVQEAVLNSTETKLDEHIYEFFNLQNVINETFWRRLGEYL